MSKEVPPIDPPLNDNVRPITEAIEKRPKSSPGIVRALRRGSRFAWHLGLGTAIHLEETSRKLVKRLAQGGEQAQAGDLAQRAQRAREAARNLSRRSRAAKLSELWDSGVERSLHLLGAPSRRDLAQLQQRAGELSFAVAHLVRESRPSVVEMEMDVEVEIVKLRKPDGD